MVAIESDIDRTSLARLRETHRFINTEMDTSMGPGVGLDFANSFWCYRRDCNPDTFGDRDEVGYWLGFDRRARSSYADELIHYAKAGRFGSLHSYGRFSEGFTRAHAARALDMLDRHDIRFKIWTNHGGYHAPNISTWLGPAPNMQGGRPLSRAYHADLLHKYGVRFFWSRHIPIGAEGVETPLVKTQLDDGRKVWAFGRSSVLVGAPSDIDRFMRKGLAVGRARRPGAVAWQPYVLDDMFSASRLDRLVEKGRFAIFAQHLGNQFGAVAFDLHAVAAFRRLRDYQDRGLILTAATERLLRFALARDHAVLATTHADGRIVLDIQAIDDPVSGRFMPTLADVRGLAVELPEAGGADIVVALNGRPLDAKAYRVHRLDGGAVAAIAWHDIDRADHSADFQTSGACERYFRIYAGDAPALPAPKPVLVSDAAALTPDGFLNAMEAAGAPAIPLAPEARAFAANEAGFAGALCATAFGQDAGEWLEVLHSLGARLRPIGAARARLAFNDPRALARWIDLSPVQDRPWAAVISLPHHGASLTAALAFLRDGVREIVSRLIHCVTVANLLARIRADHTAGRLDRIGPWLAFLARDELRRLGPGSLTERPSLPRDLAELERTCLWADLGVYGAVAAAPKAAPDPLGQQDVFLVAATPAPYLPRALDTLAVREDRYGDGADTLRLHLDTLYEMFGALTANAAMTDDVFRALGGDGARLRLACAADCAPELPSCFATRALDPRDRLLAMRAAAADGPVAVARWRDPEMPSAAEHALLGWAYFAAGDTAAAAGCFEQGVGLDPASQSSVVGLLASAYATGGVDAAPFETIGPYLAAAADAAGASEQAS